LHNYVTANGISLSLGFIGSSLIDMYSKCAYIEDAKAVIKSISYRRNVGDWNSMMSALAPQVSYRRYVAILFMGMG